MEEWRKTHDPDYEVSSLGRVRRATDGHSTKAGRVLKPSVHTSGRLVVRFGRPQRTYFVHHLVLDAFTGPRPDGHETNHKDGNPRNNRVENLEWVTRSENIQHARENALAPQGERNGRAILTEAQVREVAHMAQQMPQTEVARRFGVSKDTVSDIVCGRRWRHVQGIPRRPDLGYARGERNAATTLTEDKVREIRALAEHMPQKEIAARFGISKGTCSRIVNRKSWKHVD